MSASAPLYRSDTLLVRQVGTIAPDAPCIVTFSNWADLPTLDRAGFGEDFLAREGLAAIHVVAADNRWFHYPDRDEALAAVARAASGAARIVTYGSSMGGYAALRFAHAVGAAAAIAISPQWSLDRRVVPFERRWQGDAADIVFDERDFVPPARQLIFLDPLIAPDARHAAFYAAHGATLVPVPHAGHPAGAILVETGVLQDALRAIAADRVDLAAIRAGLRRGRRASQHYHWLLANRAAGRHPHLAVALLRRAAAIDPESHIVSALAAQLDRLGEFAEAEPLHRTAIAREPANPLARIAYARHFEARGQHRAALRILGDAMTGSTATARRQLRKVRRAMLWRWLRGVRR